MFTEHGFDGFFTSLVKVALSPITAPLAITRASERAIGIDNNPLADAIIGALPDAPFLGPTPAAAVQSVEVPQVAPPPPKTKAPTPVYYRLNPDGSVSVTSTPPERAELPPMLTEIDVASPLSATYVPPPASAPAKSPLPLLLGLAALFTFGG